MLFVFCNRGVHPKTYLKGNLVRQAAQILSLGVITKVLILIAKDSSSMINVNCNSKEEN